ncbi:RNA polymerase sigma factor [Gemmobacter serpentinus]|uniref:RNA polymerase sigma factor n=1 Tax=Gemmobacter serpentinus TaxID=2652247 RepID=UPI00124DF768|nr:sigma-70 family RNA polymerase sigma factor [Gemmobacter serpentinus]
MSALSPEELLARVAAGDRQALAALYRVLEQPLYRFVQGKLNDPMQSADIVHDVFLEVWRSAGRFEGRSSVRTWIFGIAYRKVIDVFRANARLHVTDEVPETEDDSPGALECLAVAETRDQVRHCLSTLKMEHRTAIELAFYEDMGYREISEVTGVPEGTVKTRVFHAKKLLQHCLGRFGLQGGAA